MTGTGGPRDTVGLFMIQGCEEAFSVSYLFGSRHLCSLLTKSHLDAFAMSRHEQEDANVSFSFPLQSFVQHDKIVLYRNVVSHTVAGAESVTPLGSTFIQDSPHIVS